ncbi:MAG: YadA C-terminal domain-containing protein [Tateyamaria sp.]|jgi:hypothetical protein|nr:YadA C-terminal domain-containing protein [Tateyamaria sp.]
MTNFQSYLLALSTAIIPHMCSADIYKVLWPEEAQKGNAGWNAVKIINMTSNTVFDGSMSGVYTQDLSGLKKKIEVAQGVTYLTHHSLDATAVGGPAVIEFSGSDITFRAEAAIAVNPFEGAAPAYTYDVIYKVDVTTGEVLETTLVASSAEEANAAIAAGFTVDLEASNLDRTGAGTSFQSYANNITNEVNADIETNGGLVTKQLSNPDGTSLLRKEADGTVHIGQNSIVLADEAVSASGNDEVYSSSGVLQLGNNDQHRTVIKGTLEVPTPTLGSHAANKSYVDKGDAATLKTANKYAEGIGAMMMAATQVTMTADPGSKLNIGFGLGSLSGENAFAIGLTGSSNDGSFRYSVTASYSDYVDEVAVGAGLSWSLR